VKYAFLGGFGLNKKNSGRYLCAFESWEYYAVGLTTIGTIIIQLRVSNLERADKTGFILQKFYKRFASIDDAALRVFFL